MLFRGYVQVCLEVSLGFMFGWAGAHLEVSLRLAWTLKQVWGRGHLNLSLEGSLRSPEVSRPLVPAACWVREGGERVFCVGVPYITRFLSGSFFLRPSPSTLPSMRCLPFSSVLFSAFNVWRGLRCFDFANQMPFSIILLVGCCFTCDVSLLSCAFLFITPFPWFLG